MTFLPIRSISSKTSFDGLLLSHPPPYLRFLAEPNPFADGELIYTTFKKPIKRIVFKQQGFITDSKDKRYHPTQKPSELIEMLIKEYSKEGETILDCFMGSGSTGVACVNANRNFIGIELHEGYFNIAKKRIEEAYAD